MNRKGIIDAVCSLVTAIPQSEMDTLVEAAIPLATDRKQDYDYTSAVGLLYRVATVGGDAIKRRLAAALYPSGRADNRILASVYETFGVAEPLTLEQWENLAERVVAETRQTVQRLGPDDTPLPVPETLMTSHRDTPSGRLHVAMHGTVGLESLAKKRSVLSKGAVAKIVEVLIEMSTDKDNLPTNRQRLISVLAKFADTADDRLSKSVFAALEPLAQGDGIASSEQPSAAAAAIGGDSEDVQAAALVTLAAYAGAKRDRLRQVNQALFQASVHPNEKIRKAAYVAAAKLSKISREGMLALLNGLATRAIRGKNRVSSLCNASGVTRDGVHVADIPFGHSIRCAVIRREPAIPSRHRTPKTNRAFTDDGHEGRRRSNPRRIPHGHSVRRSPCRHITSA